MKNYYEITSIIFFYYITLVNITDLKLMGNGGVGKIALLVIGVQNALVLAKSFAV